MRPRADQRDMDERTRWTTSLPAPQVPAPPPGGGVDEGVLRELRRLTWWRAVGAAYFVALLLSRLGTYLLGHEAGWAIGRGAFVLIATVLLTQTALARRRLNPSDRERVRQQERVPPLGSIGSSGLRIGLAIGGVAFLALGGLMAVEGGTTQAALVAAMGVPLVIPFALGQLARRALSPRLRRRNGSPHGGSVH